MFLQLKSDYFRIEMMTGDKKNFYATMLKSDYFRIEIGISSVSEEMSPIAKIRLF